MYSAVEGGLGWWRDTHFSTTTPKFIMGGVAPNFSEIANGPGYGVAQLSPWLLFPLDGMNLKQGTCGQLYGYGYLPLPLASRAEHAHGIPLQHDRLQQLRHRQHRRRRAATRQRPHGRVQVARAGHQAKDGCAGETRDRRRITAP